MITFFFIIIITFIILLFLLIKKKFFKTSFNFTNFTNNLQDIIEDKKIDLITNDNSNLNIRDLESNYPTLFDTIKDERYEYDEEIQGLIKSINDLEVEKVKFSEFVKDRKEKLNNLENKVYKHEMDAFNEYNELKEHTNSSLNKIKSINQGRQEIGNLEEKNRISKLKLKTQKRNLLEEINKEKEKKINLLENEKINIEKISKYKIDINLSKHKAMDALTQAKNHSMLATSSRENAEISRNLAKNYEETIKKYINNTTTNERIDNAKKDIYNDTNLIKKTIEIKKKND